jgi:hypothetical protein
MNSDDHRLQDLRPAQMIEKVVVVMPACLYQATATLFRAVAGRSRQDLNRWHQRDSSRKNLPSRLGCDRWCYSTEPCMHEESLK